MSSPSPGKSTGKSGGGFRAPPIVSPGKDPSPSPSRMVSKLPAVAALPSPFRRRPVESSGIDAELADESAVTIQSAVRAKLATNAMKRRAKRVWQRVFDPQFKIYFWFNRLNRQTQWTVPVFVQMFDERDVNGVKNMQRVVRGFMARRATMKLAREKYMRYYDSSLNKFYYLNNETKKTTWKASRWLLSMKIPLNPEDEMVYNANLKIKELEEQLKKKDEEIKMVRRTRYEELEPQVLADKLRNAKSIKRSKHMDTWSPDELAAWFTELKMDDYVQFIYDNRVDGNLFINLTMDDWKDMGIVNQFQVRKLLLIMKAYRIRYERKKEGLGGGEDDDDDELISEYAPSELSDILRDEDEDSESSYSSDGMADDAIGNQEDERYEMSAAQKYDRALDDQNIFFQIQVEGDGVNYPMIGDIVRVKYVCTLVSTGKIISSTKNGMQRKDVEFVLGVGQVIKGFDKAIPQMSIGERSNITMTASYAYGTEGLYPIIPPNAELCYDLTLLGFRSRPLWNKKLIQEPGLSEHPYRDVRVMSKMEKHAYIRNSGGESVDDMS